MNGLFPNQLYTGHLNQAGRVFSPMLWKHVTGVGLTPSGTGAGWLLADDFRNLGGILDSDISATVGTYVSEAGAYYSYQDTGNTIANVATEKNGIARISLDGTDNDETWLSPGTATTVNGVITSGTGGVQIFEARVRFGQVGNDSMACFIGMAEEGAAVADAKADNTGALAAAKDFIGFDVLHADGDALRFIYQKASQTQQIVYTKAIVASQWYNLGFAYNPAASPSKRLMVAIDNVPVAYVSATSIAAATFPSGEELNMLVGGKNGGAVASTLDIDSWASYSAD